MQNLTTRLALSFGLAAGLTGCGLFKVSTNFGTNIGSSGDAPAAANYDESAAKTSVAQTFKSWTFESCKDYDCVGKFRSAAGISEYKDAGTYVYYFNPRRAMENPDSTWLTGWNALPSDEHANEADKVYKALVLAAGNRTWVDRCHADFDAIAKEADAAYGKTKSAIDKARSSSDVYARINALIALREATEKTDGGDYVSNYVNKVGSLYDVEVALKKAFDESGRDYLYAIEGFAPRAGAALRPRDTLEKERDMYCLRAYSSGTSRTPEAVQKPGSAYFDGGATAVKAVFDDEERAALEKGREDLESRAVASLTPGAFQKVGVESVADGKGEIPGHPKLAYFERDKLPITKVKKDGHKWVVELTRHDEGTFPYDCVQTNRISQILDDGTIVYQEICKDGKETWDVSITVTISDLPEGVTLEVGDEITFYGKVLSRTEKKNDKGKTLHTYEEKASLDLEHLVSLRRKGKSIGYWFRG